MKISHIIFLIILLCGKVFAGDTNFVAEVNTIWQTRNASNIVAYVDGYLATNRNAEALFARGVIALCLENWARGAASYLDQAAGEVNTSTNYSQEQKNRLSQIIVSDKEIFEAIATDANEPISSTGKWDTNIHTLFFREVGDEFPFLS